MAAKTTGVSVGGGMVTGMESIVANMRLLLGDRIANKGIRRGVTKASRIIVKAVKSAARWRRGPGNVLYKAIGFKISTKNNRIMGIVGAKKGIKAVVGTYKRGPKKGQQKIQIPSRIFHLVEGGHARGGGKSAARAYPALGPGARNTQDKVRRTISEECAKEVATFRAKQGKR